MILHLFFYNRYGKSFKTSKILDMKNLNILKRQVYQVIPIKIRNSDINRDEIASVGYKRRFIELKRKLNREKNKVKNKRRFFSFKKLLYICNKIV